MDLSMKPDPNGWHHLYVMLGFLAFVLTIFICFFSRIVTLLIRKAQRKPIGRIPLIDKTILVLGSIGILCVLYGFFVEPYSLSVTNVQLTSDKLKSASRPIRLVQISDLHCDPQPRLEEKLPDVIAALHPDAILFTGDALNSPNGLPVLQKCLKRLAGIAPTYVVKGNWDAWYFQDVDRFAGTAVNVLDGAVKAHIAGADIWLCGLPIGTKKTVVEVVRDVPESDYRIFLYHYPDFVEEMARNKIDLYLAGHTHGGQVALPFYGAMITLSSRGKKFESGLYQYEQTHLYVNRGIGMEGGRAPRVRFLARPEVTVFEISAQPPSSVAQ